MQYQLDRAYLAHDSLLILSRVCSQWHCVAVGTPALWADIALTSSLLSTQSRTAATLTLLRSVLERAGNIFLNITVPDLLPDAAFELLSPHSEQWRHFSGTFDCLDIFLDIEGTNFPRLECLHVELLSDYLPWPPIARMPNVRTLRVACGDIITAAGFPELSFPLLNSFHFIQSIDPEQQPLVASLPQLGPDADLRLSLTVLIDQPVLHTPLTSNVKIFVLEFFDPIFDPLIYDVALKSIVAEITLPRVLHFALESNNWPLDPLPWPHPEFISLCARSSFHTHLRSLDITPVEITEPQLLDCLLALPALEKLSISDVYDFNIVNTDLAPLISDRLLMQLAITAESPPLIPHLSSITLYSRFRFDSNIFLAFVMSRLAAHRFTVELGRLSDECTRGLDLEVQIRLGELKASGQIGFEMVEPAFCEKMGEEI